MKTVLVTGNAGFIGFHLCKEFLDKGYGVVGVDNFNDQYDHVLKKNRYEELAKYKTFEQKVFDLKKRQDVLKLIPAWDFSAVFHLAARSGVMDSFETPERYFADNISAFHNALDGFNLLRQKAKDKSLLDPVFYYASSSSVYGQGQGFSVAHSTPRPLSPYGATKLMNESLANAYSAKYGMQSVGLRFFNVYGTWGRPDLCMNKFIKTIIERQDIELYNHGLNKRDFTFVGDVARNLVYLSENIHERIRHLYPETIASIFNVGAGHARSLTEVVNVLENEMGIRANVKKLSAREGEPVYTEALHPLVCGPNKNFEQGIKETVNWYKEYYGIKV